MLTQEIAALAIASGIDVLGFARASSFDRYLVKNSRRSDPALSLPDARSLIVAGVYIGGLNLPEWTDPLYGRTSRLYLSGYFLDVVKPLEIIKKFLNNQGYRAIICDSSDSERSVLPLKLAAVRAGLGWQGKHSLMISRKYGSLLALGGIITNADLDTHSTEEADHCGTCNKCRDACPTAALEQAYLLDRNKCLSNLLQKKRLPGVIRQMMENRIVDCEICQDACPWNRKHIGNPLPNSLTLYFQPEKEAWGKKFYLPDLLFITEEEYQRIFGPLHTDISYAAFRRNVIIALQHAGKTISLPVKKRIR